MRHNNLSAPTMAAFAIAVLLAGLGVLMHVDAVNIKIGVQDFWLVTAGFVVLAVATMVRGL